MIKQSYEPARPCPAIHCGRAIQRHPNGIIMQHKLPDPAKPPSCGHGYPSVPLRGGSWCAASGFTDEEWCYAI